MLALGNFTAMESDLEKRESNLKFPKFEFPFKAPKIKVKVKIPGLDGDVVAGATFAVTKEIIGKIPTLARLGYKAGHAVKHDENNGWIWPIQICACQRWVSFQPNIWLVEPDTKLVHAKCAVEPGCPGVLVLV
jgi:hypothetical protein